MTDPAVVDAIRGLVSTGPMLLVKIFFVLGVVMYGFFALVVIKQVSIMTDSIEEDINGTVKLLSRVHFLLTVLVLIVAILWL